MKPLLLLLGILLLVVPAAMAQGGDEKAFLRWQAAKPAVYAGQAVRVQLKLYYTGSVSPPDIVPRLSVPDAWTREVRGKPVPGQETIGGRTYGTAVLKTYLVIPQKPGVLRLPALPLVIRVTVPPKPDDFFQVEQAVSQTIAAPAYEMPVRPLPEPRPAAFGGAVGVFAWQVAATPDSVGVQQPVTVRYEVAGNGNLPFVALPAGAFPDGLEGFEPTSTDEFTVTETGVSGRRRFGQPLVPGRAGRYVLPLSFVYFDPARAVYVTRTDTLRLVVSDTSRQAAAAPRAVGGEAGFPAWHPGPRAATLPWLGTAWFWLACGLPVAGTAAVWAWGRWRRVRSRSPRRPYRAARAALHRIGRHPGPPHETSRTLEQVMHAYLADRYAVSGADFHPSGLRRLLRASLPGNTVETLISLLAECQALRFAAPPPPADLPRLVQRADAVLRQLEFPERKGTLRASARAVAGAAGLLLGGMAAVLASTNDPYGQAEHLYKRQQFDSAAHVLRVLAAREGAGAAVHANLAGCLFQTGQTGPAVWHWEKAARLAPGDARLQAALQAVYRRIGVPPPVVASWRRWADVRVENRLAGLALAGCWLGGLLLAGVMIFGRKAWLWPGRLAWLGAAGLLSGAVWMAGIRQTDAAAVVLAAAPGRYAPAPQARETARLPAGTTVRVEDAFGGWFKVRLPDGRRVWVREVSLRLLRSH